MTGSPMVQVDVHRLHEDLRALLYEPLRSAFLNRRRRGHPTSPSKAIEAATCHFLFELPKTRDEAQKIVSKHATDGQAARSGVHTVYAPELLKSLVLDIGREAWSCRYTGPVQIELRVQETEVSLNQIRTP